MLYKQQRLIKASNQTVYNILTDVKHYKHWNPWVIDGQGDASKAGNYITVTAKMGPFRPQFRHRIIAADSPSLFHWCDLGWFTLFAYGERKRTIEFINTNECLYTVELPVTGIGKIFAKVLFGSFMNNGLNKEADALKKLAETQGS